MIVPRQPEGVETWASLADRASADVVAARRSAEEWERNRAPSSLERQMAYEVGRLLGLDIDPKRVRDEGWDGCYYVAELDAVGLTFVGYYLSDTNGLHRTSEAEREKRVEAERRLDEAVKALREGEKWVALTQDELRALEARHEPYGAEPRRSDVRWCLSRSIDTLRCALDGVQDFQGIRKALASIEGQPERGAEGEAPSTEERS